jgi:hypothetical protein
VNCPCPQAIHAQGKGECACSRDASRRALGIEPDADPMESTTVRAIAAVLALIAVGMVMERMGIPLSWPF